VKASAERAPASHVFENYPAFGIALSGAGTAWIRVWPGMVADSVRCRPSGAARRDRVHSSFHLTYSSGIREELGSGFQSENFGSVQTAIVNIANRNVANDSALFSRMVPPGFSTI